MPSALAASPALPSQASRPFAEASPPSPETASPSARPSPLPVEALLEAARGVADRCARHAHESDRAGAFPTREFGWLGEAGLMTAALPREAGGLGLGVEPGALHALYAVLEEVGRGSLPVGRVFEGHVNALLLVHEFGSAAQRAQAARDAHAGHLFAVWNTEAAGGIRLHPAPGGGVRMEGAKTFCSGAGHVTRAFANGVLVGAPAEASWQMALVPLDEGPACAEPHAWQAEGMRASLSGRVDFEGVRLGPLGLVGRPGDYTREPQFSFGAVRFLAVQLGGARALVEAARGLLRASGREGDPHQQARMGEAAVHVETGALWLLGAARLGEAYGAGRAQPSDLVAYANMARVAVEAACLDVLRLVDRAVGARGLLPPSPVERIGRDLRLYLRQPNPDGALVAAGKAYLDSDDEGGGLAGSRAGL